MSRQGRFEDGIDEWEGIGGIIRFADKVRFFEMDLGGERYTIVRCRKNQVSVLRLRRSQNTRVATGCG